MQASIERQRGLGWFGLLLLFGIIAFFAIVVVKVGPIYLNHGTLNRVLATTAKEVGADDISGIRRTLERRWDVDYIDYIDDREIKVKRTAKGRVLAYDYSPEVNLFYNVYVVIKFKGEHLITGGSG